MQTWEVGGHRRGHRTESSPGCHGQRDASETSYQAVEGRLGKSLRIGAGAELEAIQHVMHNLMQVIGGARMVRADLGSSWVAAASECGGPPGVGRGPWSATAAPHPLYPQSAAPAPSCT